MGGTFSYPCFAKGMAESGAGAIVAESLEDINTNKGSVLLDLLKRQGPLCFVGVTCMRRAAAIVCSWQAHFCIKTTDWSCAESLYILFWLESTMAVGNLCWAGKACAALGTNQQVIGN